MNIIRRDYPDEPLTACKQVESPSVMDNLQRQKKSLEAKLLEVNEAIDALEKNPEVHKVLELLARV